MSFLIIIYLQDFWVILSCSIRNVWFFLIFLLNPFFSYEVSVLCTIWQVLRHNVAIGALSKITRWWRMTSPHLQCSSPPRYEDLRFTAKEVGHDEALTSQPADISICFLIQTPTPWPRYSNGCRPKVLVVLEMGSQPKLLHSVALSACQALVT